MREDIKTFIIQLLEQKSTLPQNQMVDEYRYLDNGHIDSIALMKFIAEIETLYSDFAAETKGKKPKEFIVFHDAYNYLMQSIGMDMNLKVPFSENVLHETGTAHLAELVQEIQLHGITHAFSEPQFSLGNLQKLANEYNLTIGTLDPLGQNSLAG